MQITDDEIFLREKVISLFNRLTGNEAGAWGKMNSWQAVEHLANFFDASSNKVIYEIVTPEEQLPKYLEFLRSEKEFRENTKAPVNIIGEEPSSVETSSYKEAIHKLDEAIKGFFDHFGNNPSAQTIHPVFGNLDYRDWITLHAKHVRHHLRQFGLMEK